MGSKSAPKAPDYKGAAEAQAASDREALNMQTWANRPTLNTPWGSQTWESQATVDPATGQKVTSWTSNINLSPEQQQALNSQMAIQQGRSDAALTLLGQATSAFQTPMDWNQLPQRAGQIQPGQLQSVNADPTVANLSAGQGPNLVTQGPATPGMQTEFGQGGPLTTNVQSGPLSFGAQGGQIQTQLSMTPGDWRQKAQDAVWDLQKPMFQERRSDLETQLANQGLARGSEAWNREMRNLSDAEARAQLQAIEVGRGEAGQLFGQDLASGQFANQAQAQGFGQSATNVGINNAAQAQMFGQGMQNAALNNAAQGQMFGQNQAAAQFGNQARQADFQNQMAALGFGNTAQQQQFQNQLAGAAFENQAAQQQFSNLMDLAQRGDQQALQQLNMQLAASQFNNQNRQQAIGEQTMQRGQTLNELNALLTGQQVNMPQMQSFSQAGRAAPTDYMGAATNQYQAALDQQNYNAGMFGNLLGAGAQLGSTALMFSDARLKEDIQPVGILRSGIRVVHYRYRGLPGRFIGVIAQEVASILPEAVALHPSGYLMVDYSKVN